MTFKSSDVGASEEPVQQFDRQGYDMRLAVGPDEAIACLKSFY
jgi:hypothetical protein